MPPVTIQRTILDGFGEMLWLDGSRIPQVGYRARHLVVFGAIIGFSTYVWLIRKDRPARVAIYAYVNPVVTVILGWTVLDEPLSFRALGQRSCLPCS